MLPGANSDSLTFTSILQYYSMIPIVNCIIFNVLLYEYMKIVFLAHEVGLAVRLDVTATDLHAQQAGVESVLHT